MIYIFFKNFNYFLFCRESQWGAKNLIFWTFKIFCYTLAKMYLIEFN